MDINCKYGVLKGVYNSSYYENGILAQCSVSKKCELSTVYGKMYPTFDVEDDRKRVLHTIEFFENGDLKSISLDFPLTIKNSYGEFSAEKIIFFDSGIVKKIFPLNGKISGYWSEEDEWKLAEKYKFKVGEVEFDNKIMSISFYEDGNVKNVKLWKNESVLIKLGVETIKAIGTISFYKNGSIKSFDPEKELKIITRFGEITCNRKIHENIFGECDSIVFDEMGNIKKIHTLQEIFHLKVGDAILTIRQNEKTSPCNEFIKIKEPVKIEFKENGIISFNDSYNITDINEIIVEKNSQKVINFEGCSV